MVKQPKINSDLHSAQKNPQFADHSSPRKSTRQRSLSEDDIIMSLSNAYENKRAQQVSEWVRAQATQWQRAA